MHVLNEQQLQNDFKCASKDPEISTKTYQVHAPVIALRRRYGLDVGRFKFPSMDSRWRTFLLAVLQDMRQDNVVRVHGQVTWCVLLKL